MVVVVPPFATGHECQPHAVAAFIVGGVTTTPKQMPNRVDREGHVVEECRTAEQRHHHELPPGRPKRGVGRRAIHSPSTYSATPSVTGAT